MELTPQEQIKKIIEKSKEILLIAAGKTNLDSVASLLAFHLFLKKLNKKSEPIAEIDSTKNLDFLPSLQEINPDLEGAKDFIISLDISRTKVDQFKYNIEKNQLNIYITPRGGYFEPHDVETKKGKSKYDLIIILNTPALENLGKLYEENAEIFYESPLVNIDYHSANENFGEINLVNLTSSSTAEILFSLFQNWDEKIIDQDIATCILTGIIAETHSFQTYNTTPNTFNIAAKLVNLDAQRETIIQNLYKKRPLSSLKLWGRTLARLKSAANQKIIWSLLSQIDFEKSESTIEQTNQILEELKNNTTTPEIIFLLAQEKPNLIHLKIKRGNKNINLGSVRDLLLPEGFEEKATREDLISLVKKEGNLKDLERIVLDKVKKVLPP